MIAEHIPRTTIILKRLEPITLLTARELEPPTAAEMLTASSGALVPMATIVRPTISEGIFIFAAREELPSTK